MEWPAPGSTVRAETGWPLTTSEDRGTDRTQRCVRVLRSIAIDCETEGLSEGESPSIAVKDDPVIIRKASTGGVDSAFYRELLFQLG